MKTILIGIIPAIGALMVKRLFDKIGLGNMFKMEGALMSGVAAAGKLSGTGDYASAITKNTMSGIRNAGNKMGSKMGKDGLGDKFADADMKKMTKVTSKALLNPVGSAKKSKKALSDSRDKLLDKKDSLKNSLVEKSSDPTHKLGYAKKLKNKIFNNKDIPDDIRELIDNNDGRAIFAAKLRAEGKTELEISEIMGISGSDKSDNYKPNNDGDYHATSAKAQDRIKNLDAKIENAKSTKEKYKYINDDYMSRITSMKSKSGFGNLDIEDVAETRKGLASQYGVGEGNVILADGGVPPIIGLNTTGKQKAYLSDDLENNKKILSNPIHYLPNNVKERLNGESDEAYSSRLHLALSDAGLYDENKNTYVDMLKHFNISDSDILKQMAGEQSKVLDSAVISVSSKDSLRLNNFSKAFDDKKKDLEKRALLALDEALAVTNQTAYTSLKSGIYNDFANSVNVEVEKALATANKDGMDDRVKNEFLKEHGRNIMGIAEKASELISEKFQSELTLRESMLADAFLSGSEEVQRQIKYDLEEIVKVRDNFASQNELLLTTLSQSLNEVSIQNLANVQEMVASQTKLLVDLSNQTQQSAKITLNNFDNHLTKGNDPFKAKLEPPKSTDKWKSAAEKFLKTSMDLERYSG